MRPIARIVYAVSFWMLMSTMGTGLEFQAAAQTPYVEKKGTIPQQPPDTLAWKRYPIEGYGNMTSVVQGDPITFMVATGNSGLEGVQYQMQIFRVGATDEIYSTPGTFTIHYQPLRDANNNPINGAQSQVHPKDYRRGCSWPAVYTLNVPLSWKSGFYYVKCALVSDPTVSRRIPFVVRQRAAGSTSNILYQISFTEYYAYASWGGGSFYWWTDSAGTLEQTDTLSFLRPLGGNFGSDLTNDLGSFDDYERNFIKWAEQAGYVMEYCTNTDVDIDGAPPSNFDFISGYKCLVIGGHDEYCSRNERTGVEGQFIRSLGSNAAFLSANMFYWIVQYLDSRTRIYCNKSGTSNLWRNQPEGPEAKFIGVQYDSAYNLTRSIDTVRVPSHWLFNGTGLQYGSGFGFGTEPTNPGILGAEVDRIFPGSSPANVTVLSSAWVQSIVRDRPTSSGPILHESAFYVDTSSNARVFGAGSQLWSSGLWSYDAPDQSRFRAFAANLMEHFLGKKYVGDIWQPVIWSSNTEIDGNVYLRPGRTLTLLNNMTLTTDASDTLFVEGTLQVSGTATLTGSGIVKVSPPGNISVDGTLQITGNVSVIGSGSLIVNSAARVNVNGYLTVNNGVTLQLNAGSSLMFGPNSRILVFGNFLASGTTGSHVTIDGQGYSRSGMLWPMVLTTAGATANIQYTDFKNAGYELTLYTNSGSCTVQHSTFTNFGYAADSKALTIYSVAGPIAVSQNTFTGSNSQGTAIYSYNTGTAVRIDTNSVTSAGTGIRCYSSNASMKFNTIHSNATYGIQCDNVQNTTQYDANDVRANGTGISLNSSSPYIMRSTVIQNGLNVLVNGGSPSFSTVGGDLRGYNTIAYAASPLLRAQNYTLTYLGYGYQGGYNSLYETDLPHLNITNNSGVWADNNYWGEGPSYYADGTSWALVRSPLPDNPNP